MQPNPLALLVAWYEEAVRAGIVEPAAMALATATRDGRPSVRIVLFRGTSGDGIRFFTNYESRKGDELRENARAAVALWWQALGKQVRLEGRVEKLAASESDEYFAGRPRGSQIAAWASPQSRPIASRASLMARVDELERQYQGRDVPRPPGWGGFRLVPEVAEFWHGRDDRLHERQLFRRAADGTWSESLLGP